MRGNYNTPWSAEQDAELLRLRSEGHSCKLIAHLTMRTEAAVTWRAHYLRTGGKITRARPGVVRAVTVPVEALKPNGTVKVGAQEKPRHALPPSIIKPVTPEQRMGRR